jgi:hypothetical protein
MQFGNPRDEANSPRLVRRLIKVGGVKSSLQRSRLLALALLGFASVAPGQNNGTIIIIGLGGTNPVVVPETINGLPVTSIGD